MKKVSKEERWTTVLFIVLIIITTIMCCGTFYFNSLHRSTKAKTSMEIPIFISVTSVLILALLIILSILYRRRIRRGEAQVKLRETIFNIMVTNAHNVFLILNYSNFVVTYVSPNIERALGVRPEEVKSDLRVLGRLSNNHGHTINYDTLHNIEPDGSLVREGQRVHKKTGEQRWFTETVYRCGSTGQEYLIVILSDQTAKWQSEYTMSEALDLARAANEAVSTFFSNMSHDIRTPMNSIVGLATLLQRDADNPAQVSEHAHKIITASQHLLRLVNDVFSMSKIETSRTRLNIGKINLVDIMDELTTIMQPQADMKRQTLNISLEEIPSKPLLGDHLRISQILINILSNAVKYTPVDGFIKMTVEELPQIADNLVHLRFTIKDNGPDMSKEYQSMIFRPFGQGIGDAPNRLQGTDLGMAITKNLIDLMGGTIEVISSQAKGTTFIVDLELRVYEQNTDDEFRAKYGISNILLIDDDDMNSLAIMDTMKESSIKIQYTPDVDDAIAKIAVSKNTQRPFDLILLDWTTPETNIPATAVRIRNELVSSAPVIILTSYDWSDIEKESLRQGASAFMSKPFDLNNLQLTLQALWEKQKLEKQPAGKPKSILKGKHILAAEDNALNAEILTELLDILEADCEVATDGQQALTIFQNSAPGQFDLILMDVQMPSMNGYEATRAIRSCGHPQAQTIPIIAMTANAFTDDIIDALASGMDAHVSKPLDLAHLETVAGEILSKKQ